MGRKYSIAIQAHGEHADEASPKISAVVQVEEDGTPQLIEMTVGTADGGPIPAGAARTIDFVKLAEALGGVVSATFALPPQSPVSSPADRSAKSTSSATAQTAVESAQPTAGKSSAKTSPDSAPHNADDEPRRPYRHMPKPSEVVGVMRSVDGSIGKLAKHYDVPRYTAQSWVTRLRKNGHDI